MLLWSLTWWQRSDTGWKYVSAWCRPEGKLWATRMKYVHLAPYTGLRPSFSSLMSASSVVRVYQYDDAWERPASYTLSRSDIRTFASSASQNARKTSVSKASRRRLPYACISCHWGKKDMLWTAVQPNGALSCVSLFLVSFLGAWNHMHWALSLVRIRWSPPSHFPCVRHRHRHPKTLVMINSTDHFISSSENGMQVAMWFLTFRPMHIHLSLYADHDHWRHGPIHPQMQGDHHSPV